ncbi:MAG: DegV family EDD domain-containing protein, partial [Dehalococcoidia bacterium]|nr:DegV family EDD domain-containing protein [Dehalococcoidia bacterium]
MAVQIVTDSTCDLPREIVEEYGITVVPLTVFFGEEALLDGVEIGADAFYERLGTSHDLPRTSQPSAERFRQVYEGLAGETSEIVSIHLSSKLSGTLNSASVARDQVAHGGLHIELIDSYTVSLGLGLVVLEAAAAARTGASLENVVAAARRAMDRVMVYVAVDTLDYLRRGGRIGRASSFLGSVLSIKPIVGIEDGEVVAEWLSQRAGHRVELLVPERGERRQLVELVRENAADSLRRYLVDQDQQRQRAEAAVSDLRDRLDLPRTPFRIECFDIATLQGDQSVGSMVVMEDGKPLKKAYRQFRIRHDHDAPNDYEMMREVLTRRLKRALDGDPKFLPLPDLLVVDGGKGQLGVAVEVCRALGLQQLPLAALAKRHEHLFVPGRGEPIVLEARMAAL